MQRKCPCSSGNTRAVSTSGPGNHTFALKEVSELESTAAVGISQVKGGEWHLPKSQGEPRFLEVKRKFGKKR